MASARICSTWSRLFGKGVAEKRFLAHAAIMDSMVQLQQKGTGEKKSKPRAGKVDRRGGARRRGRCRSCGACCPLTMRVSCCDHQEFGIE